MPSRQFNSVDGYAIGNANVIIDSNGNVAGNLVTATANVTAPRLISNVATGTAPFVVTSTTQVANLSVATAGSATTAGTVTTAAQPNITSVGTLTSLGVSGNAAALNISVSNNVTASTLTSNVAGGTAPLTVTSTTRVSNLNVAQAGVADTISVSAGTGNNFIIFANAATGNVAELTSTGLIANLSNNSITATTFVGAVSGDISAGTNANASNISSGTLNQARLANSSLTVNGTAIALGGSATITAVNPSALTIGTGLGGTSYNGSTGVTITNTGVTSITAGTNIAVSGATGAVTVSVTGTVPTATTAGTVTTAAQPNITSVGTLTALAVTGNTTIRSNVAYVSPNAANTINNQMLNGGTLAWSGNAGQLFSITDSMTGNIFTVNDVSGIPMISVDAGGNIQFAASGGFVSFGVTTAITAAGSTQGTATALTRPINVVSTVSASTGVILPTVPAGARIIIMNTSGTALNVYPPSGALINSAATNAAYSMPAGTRLEFVSVSATQWYTLNATYG